MRKILSLLLCLMLTFCSFVAVCAEEKIVISMLSHYLPEAAADGNAESMMYRMAVDKWLANHPEIELHEETVSHEVYETKVKTLAAANELPDIFAALPTYMKSFYENGQIIDLRPYIEDDAEWNDRYVAGALGDFEYGDVYLGAPRVAIYNSLIVYNTEILAEVGYDHFPATTEEFTECVIALKDAGYIPVSCGNKGQYALSSQNMPGLLFKFCGVDWYNSIRNYGDAKFTDEAPVAAITYLNELIKLGMLNEDANSIEQPQSEQMYFDRKAAMTSEGSWLIMNLIRDCPQDVLDVTDIAIFPPLADKPEYADQIVGGQGWGMSLSSALEGRKLELALDFLKTLTDPEIQAFAVEGGLLSVIKDPPYDESKLHPFYNEFLDILSQYNTVVGCPEVQLSAEYMDASYVGYQELSIGAVTPEELALSLQEAHESAE